MTEDHQDHLLVYTLQEGRLQELAAESNLLGFDWSPDSSTLVYGRSIPDAYWQRSEGESVAVDGLWQVNVRTGDASELIPAQYGYPLAAPTYSPDGNYLAFVEVEYFEGSQPFAVFDFQEQRYHRWGNHVGSFDWAPDGSFLVYDGISYLEPGEGITRSDPFGINRQILTFPGDSSSDAVPRISPTGDLVAFRRGHLAAGAPGGLGPLLVVGSDGSSVRQLTSFDIHYSYSWGPTADWLVVVTGAYESEELHLVNQRTGEAHYLVDGNEPAWQPATTITPLNAEPWLEEKATLIRELEEMDIPTSLFTVPAVAAYDESAAAELLEEVQAQYERGELSEEQLDAFIRLTLQERAFSQLLPAHTEVAATISDTTVDSVETAIGALFIAKPAWDRCRERIPLCGRLQRSTEQLVWRLVSDLGRTVIRNFGPSSESRAAGADLWDLIVNMVEDAFANGHSLQDLLVDNTIEAAATATLVRALYLGPTQQLLDDGVITADLSRTGQKPWPIRGERVRAEMMVDAYVGQAEIQQQAAVDRHEDFQAATDFIKLAEDAADIATLSPAALMAQSVAFWARVEHLVLINLPLTYFNYRDLECISYLSNEAARAVFIADEPFSGCQERESALPSHLNGQSKRAAGATTPPQSLVSVDAEEYRAAVAALVEAVEANDLNEVAAALDRLEQEEMALTARLDEVSALIAARDSASQSDETFNSAHQALTIRQLSLYLAVSSALLARQDGAEPPVDIQEVAGDLVTQLEAVEQASDMVELVAPAGPVLLIGDVQTEATTAEAVMNVTIRNIGTGDAEGAQVVVLGEDWQPVGDEMAVSLDAGAETTVVTNIPDGNLGTPMAVQLWAQDMLVDVRWLTPGVVIIEPDQTELTGETRTPTEAAGTAVSGDGEAVGDSATEESRESGPAAMVALNRAWWLAGLVLLVVAASVTGGGLWLLRQRNHVGPVVGPNRFCIHCGAEYPVNGKFCVKCGKPRE